jgi:hypothetical protein
MAGLRRPKDGVPSHAYVPVSTSYRMALKTWMPRT